MIPRGLVETLQDIQKRLRGLERRMTTRGSVSVPTSGSAAARDAVHLPPTTDAERVSLANRRITWYNTTYGWEESYFTPALPGLLAPALAAGVPAGWYPTGRGPWTVATPSTTYNVSPGVYVHGWDMHQYGRPAMASLFTWQPNWKCQVAMPGVYRVAVRFNMQTGGGYVNFHLQQLAANGTTVKHSIDGGVVALLTSFSTNYASTYERARAFAQESFAVSTHAGAVRVHEYGNPRSEFLVEYVGPLLA